MIYHVKQIGDMLVSTEVRPKRQYDIREGGRDFTLAIRLNKNEIIYIEKMAKKMKISRSALIVHHLNEHRRKIDKKENTGK